MLLLTVLIACICIGAYRLVQSLFKKSISIWPLDSMNVYGTNSRQLGNGESFFSHHHFNFCYGLVLNSKDQLTESVIWKALLALIQTQIPLRMRLVKGRHWFTHMREMEDFVLDFKVCTNTDWKAVMEEEVVKTFDVEHGPLWSVRFLPRITYENDQPNSGAFKAACVFTFNHSIMDGCSCCHFLNDFINIIGGVSEKNKFLSKPMPLLPPVEFYGPTDSYKNVLGWNMILSIFSLKIFTSLINKLKIWKDNKVIPPHCKLLTTELTQEQTSHLLSACRKHKVTVTAAFQTAASLAEVRINKSGKVTKNVCTPVNMRPHLSLTFPPEYLGFYTSILMTTTEIDPKRPFWDLATEAKQALDVKLKAQDHVRGLAYNPLLKMVQLGPATKSAPFVSNIGNMSFLGNNESRNVNLNALFVSASMTPNSLSSKNIIVTFNGKLFWSFIYNDHTTSETKAKALQEMTIQTLLHAIKE